MKSTPTLAALAMLLTSFAATAAEVIDESWPSTQITSFEAMHRAVSADFLDPMSAQYKLIVLRQPLGRNYHVICGWVNSRNSLGGFAPFVPFVYEVEADQAFLAPDYNSELTGEMALMALRNSGCPGHVLGL